RGSMRLDLGKIRTAHERYEKVYPPEAFAPDQDTFRIVAPVSLAFDIDKDKQQFHLAGSVQTTLDLRYQPHALNTGEGEREIEEDDLSTAFYDNDEIDLGQLMREQFYLSLPMKPLCSEACHGLCTVCGTNLNREK